MCLVLSIKCFANKEATDCKVRYCIKLRYTDTKKAAHYRGQLLINH